MKKSTGRKIFDVLNITFMVMLVISCLYPFFNQIALSFSSAQAVIKHRITLFPIDFTIKTYVNIIKEEAFIIGYKNTIIYSVTGTFIGLVLTTIAAYALSKKLVGGRFILLVFVFTIFFGAGLIPSYLWIRKGLHLNDSIWAVILPNVILPYHILLMRTYFQGLPPDLEDAARIDGLTQFGYFARIVLPLSKPILATMTLFISVLYWNDWFGPLLFLDDNKMHPVTLYLRNVMLGAAVAAESGQMDPSKRSIGSSVRAVSMLLVIVPIICIYPLVQKYFVKGVMIGAIKG